MRGTRKFQERTMCGRKKEKERVMQYEYDLKSFVYMHEKVIRKPIILCN
jgi:hypothetical protein